MKEASQKFISFSSQRSDIEEMNQSLKEGWSIVKLMPNNGHFIGVMEKVANNYSQPDEVFLPPQKKITFV